MWLNKFVLKSNICAKPHYSYTQPLCAIALSLSCKPLPRRATHKSAHMACNPTRQRNVSCPAHVRHFAATQQRVCSIGLSACFIGQISDRNFKFFCPRAVMVLQLCNHSIIGYPIRSVNYNRITVFNSK